ncbi:MAG TPA: VWA domain-containing protein [Terriglobales bacterium]|nr:VWA domain-containing protein [Terriglobales bacterium]
MTSGSSRGAGRRLRRKWVIAPVWLALTCLPALAQQLQQEQRQAPATTEAIRVSVERVNVGVIVTDAKGNFVENLRQQDFQVLDNDLPQSITDFATVDAPAQVLMTVEAGPAVYLLQDSHVFVADALLGGLSAGDRIAIAYYNNAPAPLLNFTTDKQVAQAALDQLQFNLGYGNLNLSSSLNTVLDWLAPVPGKKTIVLVSTGVDTSPQAAMQALLGRLQIGDVRLLAVSMSGPLRNGNKGTKAQNQETQQMLGEADAWLKMLAEATGGRAYFPENAKAFQEAYRQIAQLVRHEYSLAFAPPVADGAVHAIGVKVNGSLAGNKDKAPEYRVDHRKGYIAPKGQP